MKLAIIKNKNVENIIVGESEDFPDYIDVTDLDVAKGDTYNDDGTFSKSNNQLKAVRYITKRSLRKRFTIEERAAFRDSVDPVVVDMREDLYVYSRYVDLDLKDYKDAVDYLKSINLISDATQSKLLEDGTEEEKYRGAL
jgi:hypothetical protein